MTVVKDEEVPTAEEVAVVNKVAESEEKDDLDLMTDSKFADDWSIIGSKGLDTEGSDGESVEVIPCEEEKSEDSCSADGATPNQLAVETREKTIQTEPVFLFRNFSVWHPGVIAVSIICHLLICVLFYSANDQGELPDLKSESLPANLRPGLVELIEDWEQMSTRSPKEKAQIMKFLNTYFPLEMYDEEIVSLLEKEMMQDSTISAFHKKRPYTPNPPPPVQQRIHGKPIRPRIPPSAQANMDDHPKKFSEQKFSDPPNKHTEENKFDCSNCKKYSSECRKSCKHTKGRTLKYYYDKIIAPIVKKFNFKNKF